MNNYIESIGAINASLAKLTQAASHNVETQTDAVSAFLRMQGVLAELYQNAYTAGYQQAIKDNEVKKN